jgi:hypothetical protein
VIAIKTLLTAKCVVEVLAGLALALLPTLSASLLLGSQANVPVGTVIARIAGSALLTLGIACWLARHDSQSRAASGLLMALLFYDTAVVGTLLYARFGMGLFAIGLWPAVALHSGLGLWTMTQWNSFKWQG